MGRGTGAHGICNGRQRKGNTNVQQDGPKPAHAMARFFHSQYARIYPSYQCSCVSRPVLVSRGGGELLSLHLNLIRPRALPFPSLPFPSIPYPYRTPTPIPIPSSQVLTEVISSYLVFPLPSHRSLIQTYRPTHHHHTITTTLNSLRHAR